MFSLISVLKSTFQTAGKSQTGKLILLCLLLFGLVFWTFLPSLRGGFIDIDDGVFVIRNTHINLTLANAAWAFCHTPSVHWLPLTLWSFMLDHQLYGLKPWGYHLTNVLLHAVNTVLLFLVLRRMTGFRPEKNIGATAPQTGATWRSLIVAGLFGLHPLRVESVAWISERKDVLSVLFWMLTLWAYVRYVEKSKVQNPKFKVYYGLTLLFFALDLMSKPMVVTLPCVLLLLDYWPLGRWQQKNLRGLLVEKAPFFLLSAIGSAVTYVFLINSGALSLALTGLSLPFGARLENALVSYGRYLGKLFWPVNLCAFYPHPDHWPVQKILFAGLLVLGLSALVFVMRRQRPYLLTGWLWYLGTLVPVIGLAQAGDESMADRYSYIPSIGILIVLVWGTCQMTRGWHYQSIGLGAVGGMLVLVCIVLTRHQLGYWKDDVSVWERAIAVTENNYQAHNRLGRALFLQRRVDDAIREFQEVVRLNPGFAEAYNVLGRSFAAQGRVDDAMACFQKALKIRPDYIVVHNNLGDLLSIIGRVDEAIIQYRKALEIDPNNETVMNNLGNALASQGHFDEATVCFQKALQINPDNAETHDSLAFVLFSQGRLDETIRELQATLRLKPDQAETHCNLGFALAKQGRLDEAIHEFQESLRLKPDYTRASNNLVTALGWKAEQAKQPASSSKP